MVDNAGELDAAWVAGRERVGVTAGASAPEVLVQQVIDKLKALGAERVTPIEGIEERVVFPIPKRLV
jgi:4-hydroxy-3-methylbut-2-enyl diphosphate reductase